MHKLHELKDMLCDELQEYSNKDLSAGSLEVIDKLAHAAKNVGKLIEMYDKDDNYSSMGGSYAMYRDGNYNRRGSYARGKNAKRDSRGRYSSDGYSRNTEVIAELHEIMNDLDDEHTKMEMQKFINKIENM